MGAVASLLPGCSSVSELLVAWVWLLLLRLGRWRWPIEVHHLWTETEASLLVRLPAGYPPASLRLMHVTDAHISEGPLQPQERHHAERMHAAFASVPSRTNGSSVQPLAVFRELTDLAALAAVDVAVLSGDILNFPQAQTAAWVASTLNSSLRRSSWSGRGPGSRIPYLYCAGNHDWFYEGSPEGQRELQLAWRQTALHPLYAGSAAWAVSEGGSSRGHFDVGAYEAGGLLMVTLDNSRYQVTDRQLAFFRAQVLRWIPMILVLHVPLSVSESLRPYRGFALCGDPAWGEAVDRSWQVERRRPWPAEGNSRATAQLLEAVLAAAAPRGPLIAVLAGHVHAHDASAFGPEALVAGAPGGHGAASGAVQYIGLPAFDGGHRLLDVETDQALPADSEDPVQRLLARQRALRLLRGLTFAALGGEVEASAGLLRCWGGAAGAAAAAARLQPDAVERALGAMLRRSAASMRHGFAALARAFQPLLERALATAGGRGPAAACATEAVVPLLRGALPEWADPPELVYEPGQALELQPGCSVIAPLNEAMGAWKRQDNWEGLGIGLGAVMRSTACREEAAEAAAA